MKVCPHCRVEKDFSEFGRKTNGKLNGYCRPCNKIKCKEYGRLRLLKDPEFAERERIRAEKNRCNKPYRLVQMFHSVKTSARKRGITMNLQKQHIAALIESQNWKCARTGIEFDLTAGEGKRPFGPTVDRIDNNRGYEFDNIQIVCNVYNYAKNEFGDDDVLRFAKALVAKP